MSKFIRNRKEEQNLNKSKQLILRFFEEKKQSCPAYLYLAREWLSHQLPSHHFPPTLNKLGI